MTVKTQPIPTEIPEGAEHVFVLYHFGHKSFWKSMSLHDALHLYTFLTTSGAEFVYEVWGCDEPASDPRGHFAFVNGEWGWHLPVAS